MQEEYYFLDQKKIASLSNELNTLGIELDLIPRNDVGGHADQRGTLIGDASTAEDVYPPLSAGKEKPPVTKKFAIVGGEVRDYVIGEGIPVSEEYDIEEKQAITVAELTKEQYSDAWNIAEETGGWVVEYQARSSIPKKLSPMTDKEAWEKVMEHGRKLERGTIHQLSDTDLLSIFGTADFWDVNDKFLKQVVFDLESPKYKIYDWLAMLLNGRIRGYGDADRDIEQAKLFVRCVVDSYLKAKDIRDFVHNMQTIDYQIQEPVEIQWTAWSGEHQ